MLLLRILLLSVCYLIVATAGLPPPLRIDPNIVKEWDKVSSYWCSPTDMEENVIDSVYKCFLTNSGSRDFTIQIQCENRIFPLTLTKNDVRLRKCQNDPESASKLTACYKRLGMSIDDDAMDRMPAPPNPESNQEADFTHSEFCLSAPRSIDLNRQFLLFLIAGSLVPLAELHEEILKLDARKTRRVMLMQEREKRAHWSLSH